MLGLKGSGSHSIRFDHTRVPAGWALEADMMDMDVAGGTPGSRLHANPMYSRTGRWYRRALTYTATAEAALHVAADQHMELCRRNVEDAIHYTYGDDMLAAVGIAREVMLMRGTLSDTTIRSRRLAPRWPATERGRRGSSVIWLWRPPTATCSCATCGTARSGAPPRPAEKAATRQLTARRRITSLHCATPWRSIVLPSLFPAASRARTTKYTGPL